MTDKRLDFLVDSEEPMTGDEFVDFLNKCFDLMDRREYERNHDCRPFTTPTEHERG
jgi:hypothetical protein